MFQKELRTSLLAHLNPMRSNINLSKLERTRRTKQQFDKKATNLKPLTQNQPVYFQSPLKSWVEPGREEENIGNIFNVIVGESDGTYTGNRVHLRPKSTPLQSRHVDQDDFPYSVARSEQRRPDLDPDQTRHLHRPVSALPAVPRGQFRNTRKPDEMKEQCRRRLTSNLDQHKKKMERYCDPQALSHPRTSHQQNTKQTRLCLKKWTKSQTKSKIHI
ncbi:hypothetical protein RRG08_018482 [Elysia crispata]|uniref:Uncharacterized protein n=1 Tax=Elysia crispata TaxID=231223 RepID=A0AAE1E1I4_9GAST|nr:hypothetical protein RRG08_018482 [Elysia crispata]